MKTIEGGVCAAKGFQASGIHCGIRAGKAKKDLALILSDVECNAAAVYTTNLVKGAPLTVTKENLANGKARAVICNSGNANTCNAGGYDVARTMCNALADALSIDPSDVIVASTGVIGAPLDPAPIVNGLPALAAGLGYDNSDDASMGIMTTDTRIKKFAVEFPMGGKTCRMGGIAKGSGMIHPNMATMLVFVTCDAAVSAQMIQKALSEHVESTFNMVSVDGDTSTNDMVSVLCNGMAGNPEVTGEGSDFDAFSQALYTVMLSLSRMIAADGEGASKLLECTVSGARDLLTARKVAKSVICSSLVKTAMFGADANWGRELCAIGYAGCDVNVHTIDVSFASAEGEIAVCQGGVGVPFSEEDAKRILQQPEVKILVHLHAGEWEATAFGCDLTYDYVRINGDYRT